MGDTITGEKSPIVAVILNVCLFGIAGYIYIGQWQKGLVMIAVWFLTIGTVGSVAWIVSMVDVYMQADLLQEGKTIDQWSFFSSTDRL